MFSNPSSDYQTLIALLAAHFIADQGLQADAIIQLKARYPLILFGHAMVCAALSFIVLPVGVIFWGTLVTHFLIDWGKMRKLYDINIDQGLHIAVLLLLWLLA